MVGSCRKGIGPTADPLNFTLAEWQHAKRLDLDPPEIKQAFRDAWEHSDNLASFRGYSSQRVIGAVWSRSISTARSSQRCTRLSGTPERIA
jgi:hypothetical protein